MVRWIAFDDDTIDALMGKFKRGAAEFRNGDVLDAALRNDQPSILIYPSTSPERVLLARVSKPVAASKPVGTGKPLPVQPVRFGVGFRPPTLEDNRSWWRRHIA